jgi:putative DNA primase/helicase
MSVVENFRATMHAAGLDYAGPIYTDGKLHRVKVEGDKSRNSWFVLHSGTPAAGAFGCWKRSIKETWCAKRRENLSAAEWQTIRQQWQLAESERQRTEAERHAKTRKIAAWILARAKLATAHAYLDAKAVKIPSDVREHLGALVLPLRDVDGELHSLQFIGADGGKRFLTGGKIAGCFFTLADKPDSPLVICEGYATGASIHEATSYAVVCAMNCGNLLAVSKALREKFPTRDIIIGADNDQLTDGNPGLAKATEAAKAIGARLAVPQFNDTTTKPTDFNDLHQLEGLTTMKDQIEGAQVPKESDDELLKRLAALPPLEYERCRDAEAERLGVRVSVLDKMVDTKRPNSGAQADDLQGRTLNLADVELWPDAVNGADVLAEIASTFARYVALPDGAADAITLFAAHTHCYDLFQCSPRLNIKSPDKRCGKTTLRDVLALFVSRPLPTENLSVAVLFRVIESKKPTLLADECDAWIGDNEELRGLLNAGHRRGGQALRCEGEGNEVRAFNVFAPVVLCGIGALPGTLHDRSIVIPLERAKPNELRQRFDSRHVEQETEICRKLARWCADNLAQLEACDPVLPSGAFNRLADNWRPLFAIAEIAGGDWPQRAADAFAKLTAKTDTDAQGIGTMLLADIRRVFNEANAERMLSKTLVDTLCSMSDRPWPEANRGRPITPTWMARRLHSFNVSSKTIRVGDERANGYELAHFQDAFDRYLPDPGLLKRDNVTTPDFTGGNPTFQSVTDPAHVTDAEADETPANIELSRCHASNPPVLEEREAMLI